NNIPTAIYDINGQLLFSIGWKPVCVKYHHCRIGSRNQCYELIRKINQNNPISSIDFQCNNGVNGIAVPVTIRNKHIATLVLSQFLYQDEHIDYPFFTKLAE